MKHYLAYLKSDEYDITYSFPFTVSNNKEYNKVLAMETETAIKHVVGRNPNKPNLADTLSVTQVDKISAAEYEEIIFEDRYDD